MALVKGETVYSAQAYYYGTITTKQVATQIAQEVGLDTGRRDRGHRTSRLFLPNPWRLVTKIKLDGLGIFYNEVAHREKRKHTQEVTAKLVKSIRPAFNAEYTILNGTFPLCAPAREKTNLVRIDFKGGVPIVTPEEGDSEIPTRSDLQELCIIHPQI